MAVFQYMHFGKVWYWLLFLLLWVVIEIVIFEKCVTFLSVRTFLCLFYLNSTKESKCDHSASNCKNISTGHHIYAVFFFHSYCIVPFPFFNFFLSCCSRRARKPVMEVKEGKFIQIIKLKTIVYFHQFSFLVKFMESGFNLW